MTCHACLHANPTSILMVYTTNPTHDLPGLDVTGSGFLFLCTSGLLQ